MGKEGHEDVQDSVESAHALKRVASSSLPSSLWGVILRELLRLLSKYFILGVSVRKELHKEYCVEHGFTYIIRKPVNK